MSRSRNVRTKLRLHSVEACLLRARKARGKPPRPQSLRHASAPVSAKVEASQVHEPDPTRKGFRHTLHQLGRSAGQQQETRVVVRAVHQHAKRFKERRHPLDFVDDYEAPQPAEGLLGRGEALPVDRGFQIEVCASRGLGGDLPGKRGLATLARAGQRGAGVNLEGFPDASGGRGAFDKHGLENIP